MFEGIGKLLARLLTPAPPKPAEAELKKPARAEPASLLPPDQAAVIAHAKAGLKLLCKRSGRARDLSIFFYTNSVEAEIIPEGVKVVSAPGYRYPFLVIGVPAEHETTGKRSFIGARFSGHSGPVPIIELRGTQFHTLGAGLMLAHELTHAEEHFFHSEPASEFPDPNWLMGEIVAHRSIFQVLNEYTDGAWLRAIENRVRRVEAFLASKGQDPKLAVFGQNSEDVAAIKGMLPDIDDVTIGMLLAQMDVDTNMARVDQWSDRLSLPDMDRRMVAISTMHGFYERMEYNAGR